MPLLYLANTKQKFPVKLSDVQCLIGPAGKGASQALDSTAGICENIIKKEKISNTSTKTENYVFKNTFFYPKYPRAITENNLERFNCIFACKFPAAILEK